MFTYELGVMRSRRLLAAIIPSLCLLWPGLLLLAVDPADFNVLQKVALIALGGCSIGLLMPFSWNLRTLWVLNFPFALFAAVYGGFVFEFRQAPSAAMWESIFASDTRELREQLALHASFIVIGIAILVIYVLVGCSRTAQSVKIARPARLAGAAVAGWTVLIAIGLPTLWQPESISYIKLLPIDVLYASYPTGAVVTGWQALNQKRRAQSVPIPSVSFVKPIRRRVVVLVIGEAEQYFRWRSVAEDRESWLIHPADDLILFSDNYSQANLTLNSVPMLLTGAPTKGRARVSPTWLQYARATGCRTVWLSNNEFISQGHYDDAVDVERTTYELNPSGDSVVYDDVLVRELDRNLIQERSNLCIVLHMMGSHANYMDRYPAAEQRYAVNTSAYLNPFAPDFRGAQRAAYMNAVGHSQRVVENIVARLRQEKDTDGFMIYVPDHGENMFDDGSGAMTHGRKHPSAFELRVPLLVWASDSFRRERSPEWTNLRALSTTASSSRSVFPTLLDVLGVDSKTELPSLLQQSPTLTLEPFFAIGDDQVPVSQLGAMAQASKQEKTLDP